MLRICDARDAQIADFETSFMDGTAITRLNVSLSELGVTEIKFIEQGDRLPSLCFALLGLLLPYFGREKED